MAQFEPNSPPRTGPLWCLALPLAEERHFSGTERAALQRRILVLLLGGIAGLLGVPLLLGGAALLLWRGEMGAITQTLPIFIISPVLVVLSIFFAYLCFKRWGILRRELRNGRIQRFAMPSSETVNEENRFAEAYFRRRRIPFINRVDTIELFRATGRLLRVNDTPYTGWEVLPRNDTASVPLPLSMAAHWLDLPTDEDGEESSAAIYGGQRPLANYEKAELARWAHDAWRLPLRDGLIISILPAVMLLLFLLLRMPWQLTSFWVWILAAVWLFTLLRLIPGWLFSRRLRYARDGNLVLLIRYPRATEEDPYNETVVELLPIANILWALDSEVAPWRRR